MKKISVLLLDDDVQTRESLATYLQIEANFRVVQFSDGRSALNHLEIHSEEYTAVVLDYVLHPSSLTGDQVINAIRQEHPRLPVIVISGLDPVGGVQALERGAHRLMRRPVSPIEIVNTISNLASQDRIFRHIAETVRRMLGSDMCLAWRFERHKRRLWVAAWDGSEDLDKEYRRITLDLDHPATMRFLSAGKPVYLLDVTREDRAPYYRHREEAIKRGWTSLVSIPLIRQGRLIGLVDSYSHSRFEMTEELRHVWLEMVLPAFADQAAEAVAYADLANRLQALQGVNQVVAGSFEESTILGLILSKAVELVGGDVGWLYVKDEKTGRLVLKNWTGMPKWARFEPEIGIGVTGIVAETGEALYIADVSKDDRHKPIPNIDIKSEVAVPLRREEQSIGALMVASHFSEAFTDDDVDLLVALAAQASIVIERTSLTMHSQEVSRLVLTGDFDRLAKYVVEAASELTGADVILWMTSEQGKDRGKLLRIQSSSRKEILDNYESNAAIPITPGSSVTGKALKEAHPIIARDILDAYDLPGEAAFHVAEIRQDQGWRSFMAVPLIGRDEMPLGSLNLYSREVAKFGAPDAESMQTFANQVIIAFENIQNAQQVETLRVLGEVGHALTSSIRLTQEEILELLWHQSSKLIDVDNMYVALYDEVTDIVRFELAFVDGQRVDTQTQPGWGPRRAGKGKTEEIIRTKAPLLHSSPAEAQHWYAQPGHLEYIGKISASWLGVPMLVEDKVVGVIVCSHPTEENMFKQDDLWILQVIANYTAIALSNSRMAYDINDRLHTLVEFGRMITSGMLTQEHEVLELVHKQASRLMDASNMFVALYDEAHDIVRFGLAYVDGRRVNVLIEPGWQPRQSGRGWAEYIIRTKQPLLVSTEEEARKLYDTPEMTEYIGAPMTSWLGVPMVAGEEVLGIIATYHPIHEYAYSSNDLEILQAISRQTAIALKNVYLHGDLQRRVQHVLTLNKVATLARGLLERKEILQIIVETTRSTLGATYCDLFLLEGDATLVSQAIAGKITGEVDRRRFRLGEGLVGWVAQEAESLLVTSTSREPRLVPNEVSQDLPQSMILAPLWAEGEVIGIIAVVQAKEAAFDDTDQLFLETLAVQAGIAIHQASQREQRVKAFQRRFNPYVVGEPIRDPDRFYGRKKLIQHILDGIHHNNYIIYGERRIGKTSLLLQLTHHLEVISIEEESYYFLPVLLSLEGVPEGRFFDFLMGRIARAALISQDELMHWQEQPTYDHHDFEDDLEKIIHTLQARFPLKKIRIVLLLDEMDQFIDYEPVIHERFRSLFTTQPGAYLTMVMAGVSIHRVQQTRTSPWYNLFQTIELPILDRVAARQLVVEPVAGYYTYEYNAVEAILEYSDLKPQEIQRLARFSVFIMLDRVSSSVDDKIPKSAQIEAVVSIDDVLEAVNLAIKDKDDEYRHLWQQFGETQRQSLRYSAAKGKVVDLSQTFSDGAGLFLREDLYNIARFEEQKVYLTHLFAEWLRRAQL